MSQTKLHKGSTASKSCFEFESLSFDMCNTVIRFMTFSTLVAMSRTSKLQRDNIQTQSKIMFQDAVNAATSWYKFIIGASLIYKLGRFIGHRPIVPIEFQRHCRGCIQDLRIDIRITQAAMEFSYFVMGASWQSTHKKILKSGVLEYKTNVQHLMRLVNLYILSDKRKTIRFRDVERAIHHFYEPRPYMKFEKTTLVFTPIDHCYKITHHCADELDDEQLDPNFEQSDSDYDSHDDLADEVVDDLRWVKDDLERLKKVYQL